LPGLGREQWVGSVLGQGKEDHWGESWAVFGTAAGEWKQAVRNAKVFNSEAMFLLNC